MNGIIAHGDVSFNEFLTVEKNATFNDKVIVNNDKLMAKAGLEVTGGATMNDALTVAKAATFSTTVSSLGHMYAQGDLYANNKLYVANKATLSGDVDICGNFYAQYPANSIPSAAINGLTALIAGAGTGTVTAQGTGGGGGTVDFS